VGNTFEKISDIEIVELAEMHKRAISAGANDAGSLFIAQLLGMRRLITSGRVAHEELLASQRAGHEDMLAEQRRLVRWQQSLTIATWLLVIATIVLTVAK